MRRQSTKCFSARLRACAHIDVGQPLACALIALLLCLLHGSALAQSPYPQRVDQQINDYAGVLTDANKTTIRDIQAQLQRERGAELVIATIGSIADYDVPDRAIEAFATGLFNSWGIGDRQRNDGVLLLVAIRDRKVRIEVGSGYGATYNDAMQHVIDDDILPSFRSGEYSAGIVRGVGGIQAALEAAPTTRNALAANLPLVGGLLLAAGVVMSVIAKLARQRYRRRGVPPARQTVLCKACHRPMDELGIELVSADLDAGQQVEQQLRSMYHQVWECRTCGSRKRKSTPGATLRYRACPKCRYRALEEDEEITQPPTATRRGLKVTTRRCHYCGYTTELKSKLAQKRPSYGVNSAYASDDGSSSTSYSASSSDSSSSASYNSGSSSDSGGSSSGDGASGSW